MAPQLIEDALGDPRNAEFLVMASDLAYLPAIPADSPLGMEARLICAGNTQAYILGNDDHLVVAFRGTEAPTSLEGIKDWLLTDAVNLLIVPEGRLGTDLAAAGVGARFHQGFVNALGEIWEPVYAAVQAELKRKERPLWLTGHSLGGALALLAGWLFQRKMIPVHQIYTFGAPMIGNEDAAKAYDREFPNRVYRYVNGLDFVPRLPTVSLVANQYGHCLKDICLGEGAADGAFFQEVAGKTVDGLLSATLIDDLWRGLQDRVGAHGMDIYRSLVAGLFKKS